MRARRPAERGTSTVELAMVLPLLAALAVALSGVLLLARDAVLAQGAAREGARAAAVGGDMPAASAAARAALPPGREARVDVVKRGRDRVQVDVRLALALPYLRRLTIRSSAVAAVEPGQARPERSEGR